MLQLVDSVDEIKAIEVNVRPDTGIADVYLNKNIETTTDEEGNTRYTAEQAYMQYSYFDGLEDELETNFDEYYTVASGWTQAKPLTVSERIAAIEDCLLELSEEIYA